MTGKLEGKVAMITGGNSGIGEATAYRLASEGAKILLLARRSKESIEVTDTINNSGGHATYVRCDVGDANSVDIAVHEASEAYGTIDILFNNAGGGGPGDFPDSTIEDWNQVINVNLNGTFYVSKAVWPHLISAGGGAVVNMSSLAAQRGFSPKMRNDFGTTAPSYYAAKAGIEGLTRYMAGVGGEHGIRVNAVRPGQIMTPGATRGTINDPDGGHHLFEKMFELAQIIPGPGQAKDVADLVLFLVSKESRFITGELINVDGGVAAKI